MGQMGRKNIFLKLSNTSQSNISMKRKMKSSPNQELWSEFLRILQIFNLLN
jgi:hypothetical protein